VPFGRSCPSTPPFLATLDPATLLPTDTLQEEPLQSAALQFLDHEFLEDDVNKFVALARSRVPFSTLVQATERELDESHRYRDILATRALGDELRGVLRSGSTCWGCFCLHRERGAPAISVAEARFIAGLAPHIAAGLRTALLVGQTAAPGTGRAPGLLVLADDLSVIASTPLAQEWLSELNLDQTGIGELPPAIYMVAARLWALERGQQLEAQLMPRVRLRTPAGRWLLVHASCMPRA